MIYKVMIDQSNDESPEMVTFRGVEIAIGEAVFFSSKKNLAKLADDVLTIKEYPEGVPETNILGEKIIIHKA